MPGDTLAFPDGTLYAVRAGDTVASIAQKHGLSTPAIVSLNRDLLSSVSTLILFEMKRSHTRAQSQGKIQPVVVVKAARETGRKELPFPCP